MPPKYPSFRRGRDGIPVLYDSDAARQFKERAWFPPQTASQVEYLAKECVRERGGDVNDRKDVLGEFILQSGKYRGQKFCWLLENCPGYVGWFVGSILEDRVKGDQSSVTQMANKDSLLVYCSLFEESRAIVSQKLSGRSKRIQDEWKRHCEKRNVVPGQQFHLLLSARELSPEALQRKVRRIATPKRVTPNLNQPSRSPATADDFKLLEAVQEFEVQSGVLQSPEVEISKVRRKLLQESALPSATSSTAAPAVVWPSATTTAAPAVVRPSATATAATALVRPSATATAAPAVVRPSATTTAAPAVVRPSQLPLLYCLS